MYTNDYMYAIERNDEYLAHFGVKGMRWGVRKARETGNSRRLGRMYQKASKKLAKLEKRAASGKKYARRAAALGAGAAVAGGLAYRGTKVVGDVLGGVHRGSKKLGAGMVTGANAVQGFMARRGKGGKTAAITGAISRAGHNLQNANGINGAMTKSLAGATRAANAWGNSTSISNKLIGLNGKGINALGNRGAGAAALGKANRKLAGVSNNTIARIGAGAIGAGLAGAAGYNAYRAATTKRAAKKAAAWKSEMDKAFAGTQYANGGGNRQGKKRKRR